MKGGAHAKSMGGPNVGPQRVFSRCSDKGLGSAFFWQQYVAKIQVYT